MNVLYLSSEVAPFAKTGGLADVAGSLPGALRKKGIDIRVGMPKYQCVKLSGNQTVAEGVPVYFVDNPALYDRPALYGDKNGDYPDNLERFRFFSEAVLDLAESMEFKPDILHCNDWQTSLVPVFLKSRFKDEPFWKNAKTVFTIHNLGYQGIFPKQSFPKTGLDWSLFQMEALEFYDQVNLLKGGLVFSDKLTTVSPTYAREIQTPEFGHRLEGVLSKRRADLVGILNGIDASQWDPSVDKELLRPFSRKDPSGKAENKGDLQRRCGLPERKDVPLFGMVSRLADQKGIDLLLEGMERLLSEDLQVVLLGSGDPAVETAFRQAAQRFRQKLSVFLKFDAVLAKKIYAGCDFFLMPSRYEPCGLGQMIALRYGTLPVVRATGGLADTIVDVTRSPETGNGFVFEPYRTEDFLGAVARAVEAFRDTQRFGELIRRAMACDFSWERSAEATVRLYQSLLPQKEKVRVSR